MLLLSVTALAADDWQYSIADGNAKINGINLSAGDRIFISENEGMLSLSGNATVLVCRP